MADFPITKVGNINELLFGDITIRNVSGGVFPKGWESVKFNASIVRHPSNNSHIDGVLSFTFIQPLENYKSRFQFGQEIVQSKISVGDVLLFGRASIQNVAQGALQKSIGDCLRVSKLVVISKVSPYTTYDLNEDVLDRLLDNRADFHFGTDARVVPVQGFLSLNFGDIEKIDKPLSIRPSAISPKTIGLPSLNRGENGAAVFLDLYLSHSIYPLYRFSFGNAPQPQLTTKTGAFNATAYGHAYIANVAQGIAAQGYKKPIQIGHAVVSFKAVEREKQGLVSFSLVSGVISTNSKNIPYYFWVANEINNIGFDNNKFGSTNIFNTISFITQTGFDAQKFGLSVIKNDKDQFYPLGFDSYKSGVLFINNTGRAIIVQGISSTLTFGENFVYNLQQYISLNNHGINSALYGAAYVQGGVKKLTYIGSDTSRYGVVTVINTTADQYINLSTKGIIPPTMPNPNVSPSIVYAKSLIGSIYGNPVVQFPPRAQGFTATNYGLPWLSHSPRYIETLSIISFESGYLRIFDPTQKIAVTGVNTIIAGGIFGDIHARNIRRIINVAGLNTLVISDWTSIESNSRAVEIRGFNTQSLGLNSIKNRTPSIVPGGIYSFVSLNSAIGYWVRTVKTSGFYQPKFGSPTFTKTPELNPNSFHSNIFGATWISYKTRSIYTGLGRESLIFGGVTVWHYSRKLNPVGIKNDTYGSSRIEHGRRLLLAQGSNQAIYGNNTWVSFAQRYVQSISIVYANIPIHRVGGTQRINPPGYIATLFGTRIVPESQSIYPQGFINLFGLTFVDLWRKYIKPNGFLTTGQEAGHRFGTAKFWNLRQYIEIYYDIDSGLVPPLWTGWTSINNRNKLIGAIGSNCSRIAEPTIENKARPILPFGFDSVVIFSRTMIADRVRNLKLQGLDTPYIGSWSVVFNSAAVLASKGFNSQSFGIASIANTRRYFNRIGNFESLLIGFPMVSYRIRKLIFEQRYAISPPYIPIHRIDLHTRYIEEAGRFDDHQTFGNPSLSIHWNIITPRWTLRDAYGTATIKNLTPELATQGRNSEEFGDHSIRTQWRELLHLGGETVVWGRSEIAFRDRQFLVSGFTQWAIPRHIVIKTGVPPYYPQYIWLDAVELDGTQNSGHGIKIPERQVSDPSVKSNVISSEGFVASRYGNHYTQSNGILVQPGLQELTIGSHFVGLKNRNVAVPSLGDLMIVSKPRLSPHTVYAVMESPEQARQNHESRGLHFVNSDYGNRQPGEVFGLTTITLQHRKLSVDLGNQSDLGNGHRIELRKRYINLKDFGFRSQRIGFHVVGPFDQNIIQFDSNNMQGFGRPSLNITDGGIFFIKPDGLNPPSLNRYTVDFFNRTIKAVGSNHLQMGTRESDDTPFMWQGLRIGELIEGSYGGFKNEAFGNIFISLKVRDLKVQGFESFVMEYDYTQFDKRMRIIRQELPTQKLFIKPVGVDALCMAVPNIKPAVHFIRPDGNADQYRKGAF